MTIAEVCKKFDLTADTLRYYERIGLLPHVKRTSGIRNYSEDDCGWIDFIKHMRKSGVQIEALIQYVTLYHQGIETSEARKQILVEQRSKIAGRIEEMQSMLELLNYKIEQYEKVIVPTEERLKVPEGE